MKCTQKNCEQETTLSYVWPGNDVPSLVCEHHARQARGVAEAMGFPLVILPIEVIPVLEESVGERRTRRALVTLSVAGHRMLVCQTVVRIAPS